MLDPHQSPITSHHSLRALLCEAIAQLEREHVPSAPLAAELLLMHALGQDRTWIYAHSETVPEEAAREQYFYLVARRARGVPTQYLTGHQEFWGLEFEVTPDVLIPRPETEHVIEVAIERLDAAASQRDEELRIADIGTGSGCITVSLAHEFPASKIVATDISAAALNIARRNAARHGVASRIEFIECNLADVFEHELRITNHKSPVPTNQSPPFDLIASNPPYIGREEAATLPREVREHEPEAALFGGETGTELYAPLIAQAAILLKPGGSLVLELGHNSADHVSRLLDTPQWTSVSLTKDLAGIRRVASAQRSSK